MSSKAYNRREREDGYGSDTSTIKAVPLTRSSTDSVKSYGKFCYVNSAISIENEHSDGFDSSEEEISEGESVGKPQTTTRKKQLDLSPEAVQKRKEVYNKWLQSVKEREKEKKRLEEDKRAAEEAEKEAAEHRKVETEAKVQAWMEKKRIQAEEKMARIVEMKKKLMAEQQKPKEFKKAIKYKDWIQQKNENLMLEKKRREDEEKLEKTYRKLRESVASESYDKWSRSSASKPKPVAPGRGLDSLRGSSTKIYVNPKPWVDDV